MDPDTRKAWITKRNFFNGLNSENLLSNIWQVSINSLLIAAINLLFHSIMSRYLGPSEYGELETLLTINSLLLIALSSVSFIMARFASVYRSRQQFDKMKYLANWAFVFFFLIGLAGVIINLIFSQITAEYLQIDIAIVEVFGLLIWISFLLPIIDGIFRGLLEFRLIGKYKLLEAILRLIIAGTLIYLGLKIKAILLGFVLAGIITILFAAYILKKMYLTKPYGFNISEIYIYAIPVFLSMTCFALLANVDLILVKHFFDAQTTGYFAAASILAKTVLLMAIGSAGVMFPKVVEEYSNGNMKNVIKTFRNTIKIVLIAGILISFLLMFFPESISQTMFGPQYKIGTMLSIYSISMLFLSISGVLMMYNLALKKYNYLPILIVAVFITIYQINKLHHNLYNIVWTLFIVNAIFLTYMIYINRKDLFSKFENYDY